MLDRRAFLARTGVALAVAAVPSKLLAAVRKNTPPPANVGDWASVRAQFALAPGQLHFASFYLASHPRPVREAIEAFRRTLDEDPFLVTEHRMFTPGDQNLQFSIRDDIAPYLGAQRDELALNDQCKSGLAAMKNVTLHTPRDASLSAGLVAFEVAGVAPDAVVARLLEHRIVASTAPYKANYARLAPSLVNDEAEVEAALREVREIAGG